VFPASILGPEENFGYRGYCFSKHQLAGAFEKDEFPAIIFAGAPGAFRILVFGLQMPRKFRLVAETGRAPFIFPLIRLQSSHSGFYIATIPKSIQDFLSVFAVDFRDVFC
jgi:hypothetical protein